jgi:hypothetical protein
LRGVAQERQVHKAWNIHLYVERVAALHGHGRNRYLAHTQYYEREVLSGLGVVLV